jgi:hypothetical protein|tara:strand:+ start:2237 stop:2473 length:237 start_codon:yes stop_codon:yes gene_type:complete
MMGKKISTYYSDDIEGQFCEVHVDYKEERFYVKYFDEAGNVMQVEHFPDKALRYVENAAENWALGIKKLTGEIQLGLL